MIKKRSVNGYFEIIILNKKIKLIKLEFVVGKRAMLLYS